MGKNDGRKISPLTGEIMKRGEQLMNDLMMAEIGRPEFMSEEGRRKYADRIKQPKDEDDQKSSNEE